MSFSDSRTGTLSGNYLSVHSLSVYLMCSYYRGAVGAFIVFDLTRRDTFEHVDSWIHELHQSVNGTIPILLVMCPWEVIRLGWK